MFVSSIIDQIVQIGTSIEQMVAENDPERIYGTPENEVEVYRTGDSGEFLKIHRDEDLGDVRRYVNKVPESFQPRNVVLDELNGDLSDCVALLQPAPDQKLGERMEREGLEAARPLIEVTDDVVQTGLKFSHSEQDQVGEGYGFYDRELVRTDVTQTGDVSEIMGRTNALIPYNTITDYLIEQQGFSPQETINFVAEESRFLKTNSGEETSTEAYFRHGAFNTNYSRI